VAFVGALVFGLGYTMWSQSLLAEVYGLMTFFVAAVTYFLLKWNRTRQDRYFLLACALYALSLGNHLLIVGFLPAFIFMTVATDRGVFFDPKKIALVVLFILVGISQYGYIVWRTNDPSTPYLEMTTGSLLRFLSSPQTTAASRLSLHEIRYTRLPMFLEFFWREYYLLIPLGVWGFSQIKDRTIRAFVGIFLLSTLLVAFLRFAREYENYFLPVYLAFTICIGFGLEWAARLLSRRSGLVYSLLLIPVLFAWGNYARVDHSQRTLHARIVEKVLRVVDSDALILAPNYDYATFYWYYLIGEGYGERNLYSTQVDYGNLDAVRAYLAGEQRIYIPTQRLSVPFGLRVYVMDETAAELAKIGLEVRPTDTRYIYRAALPGEGE
jgi:hypothetical protein